MVNGTLLNFGKRYEDNLRVIVDQWPNLHLGLDALNNQKILKSIYCAPMHKDFGINTHFTLLQLATPIAKSEDLKSKISKRFEYLKISKIR